MNGIKKYFADRCRGSLCQVRASQSSTIVGGERINGREIRPLQILTGGSPRLLVIAAGFGRHQSLPLVSR